MFIFLLPVAYFLSDDFIQPLANAPSPLPAPWSVEEIGRVLCEKANLGTAQEYRVSTFRQATVRVVPGSPFFTVRGTGSCRFPT